MCSIKDSDYEREGVESKIHEINSIEDNDNVAFNDKIESINSDTISKDCVSQNTKDVVNFSKKKDFNNKTVEEINLKEQDGFKDIIQEELR